MEEIIKADPTLDYFINNANINWFDSFQVNLRCVALEIALWKYLNKKY